MDVNQIAFIILISFGVLTFLYLLGCEKKIVDTKLRNMDNQNSSEQTFLE